MFHKSVVGLILVLAVVGLGLLFSQSTGVNPARVAAAGAAAGDRTISVSGAASVGVKPDVARATFGVETFLPTLQAALAENNRLMSSVIAKLKELGIADKDIQTVNFNVSVERSFDRGVPGPITGYRVSNSVRATIRQLDKVGNVIDQAIAAGANSVGGISFGVSEAGPLQSQARAKAVADAQAKAQELAKAAGIQLGPVISIVETGVSAPQPADRAFAAPQATVPVEGGELSVSVSVQVVYGIQ